MSLELLKGIDEIGRGVDKHWIYKDLLHRELAHDYLQIINYSIQDINFLIGDSGQIKTRTDVISLIVMINWIADSVWQYKSCLAEGLMDSFWFSGCEKLKRCYAFIKALRSIVVAHPLTTNKHEDMGFDGDIICIDLRVDQPFLFPGRNNVRRFGMNGIEPYITKRSDDVYLYVCSKKTNAQSFEYLVIDLVDVISVARVYADQLYEIDKHLSKLRKKDYAVK